MVGTDGYWIQPVQNVDYVIIHSGERFDFLLEANHTRKDYWIRAETLEIDQNGQGPPYKSLGHVAEAILHYKEDEDSADPNVNVPSTKYEDIKKKVSSPTVLLLQTMQSSELPIQELPSTLSYYLY